MTRGFFLSQFRYNRRHYGTLNAHNVSQSFGALDLFSGVNVSIPNDGKIGLVGPNGIGKTTLLLILAGWHARLPERCT
jgi:ATPase subunit of ABC transporter with duplicated ATPase domains